MLIAINQLLGTIHTKSLAIYLHIHHHHQIVNTHHGANVRNGNDHPQRLIIQVMRLHLAHQHQKKIAKDGNVVGERKKNERIGRERIERLELERIWHAETELL